MPEVDYTISTGSVYPFLVLLNPLPVGTNVYVEWSNSILDDVILYLETMIYNSINSSLKQSGTNLTTGNVYYSPLQEQQLDILEQLILVEKNGMKYRNWILIVG